jgi:hypothetical protein
MQEQRTTAQILMEITWRMNTAIRYATILDDRLHSGQSSTIEPYPALMDKELDTLTELHVEFNGALRKKLRQQEAA